MIERYTRPEMGAVWTDDNRYRKWLEVEIAVCEAWARLGKIPKPALRDIRRKAGFSTARIDEVVRWRREHQPGGQNAGSVFTNPPGDAAGRLIEEAGLKGFRIGSAVVSDRHANFIQADPGGSADDVKRLIDEVRALVAERLGVELRTELRLVGFEEGS